MTIKHKITWEEFFQDTLSLIEKIRPRAFKGLVTITRGGLAPAAIITNYYPLRKVESFGLSSYQQGKQVELRAHTIPEEAIKDLGENWLIIDELADSGNTIKYTRTLLPHAFIATVYTKKNGSALVDAYAREFSNDTWLMFPWEPTGGVD